MVFVVSDGDVYAHRIILQQVSDVWARMFVEDVRLTNVFEIEVPEAGSVAMRVLLRLIYTAKVDKSDWAGKYLNEDIVPLDVLHSVVDLANKYMVSSVISMVTQTLKPCIESATDASDVWV